jgi:hypothetical protein
LKFLEVKKLQFQAVQKGSDARRATIDERGRTHMVRWSEAIERNDADECFSTACINKEDNHGQAQN